MAFIKITNDLFLNKRHLLNILLKLMIKVKMQKFILNIMRSAFLIQ